MKIINKLLLIILCLFSLSACDKIAETLMDKVAGEIQDVTPEQNAKAAELYSALIQRDQAKIKQLVDPKVSDELNAKVGLLQSIYAVLPHSIAENPTVVMQSNMVHTQVGKYYTVTYEYAYPNEMVIFNVDFKGHDGGTDILGFGVNHKK